MIPPVPRLIQGIDTEPLTFEQQKTHDWRLTCFSSMGYEGPILEALVTSPNADLSTARRLHAAGCSLSTMLRILM